MYSNVAIIALLALTQCINADSASSEVIFDLTDKPVTSETRILYDKIEVNSVVLDAIETSGVALLMLGVQELKVLDQDFGKIFVFDHTGRLKRTELGAGQGPGELPGGLAMFLATNPNNPDVNYLIGGSYDVYEFDGEWQRQRFTRIRWIHRKPVEVLGKNPDPTDHRSYDLGYYVNRRLGATSTHLYLTLISGYPLDTEFNSTTHLFANQARVLGRMRLSDGQVDTILGRLSPIYAADERYRTFDFFHPEILSDEMMLITYMPDSLIYTIDLPFTVTGAFGRSGRDMNLDYQAFPESREEEDLRAHLIQEFESRGFYTSLRHIKERGLVFRTYTRGSHSPNDGLQIYQSQVLIADVDVPKGFKIAGYAEPYFYSEPMYDKDSDRFTIHSFALTPANP
jgi:hypothetical protein